MSRWCSMVSTMVDNGCTLNRETVYGACACCLVPAIECTAIINIPIINLFSLYFLPPIVTTRRVVERLNRSHCTALSLNFCRCAVQFRCEMRVTPLPEIGLRHLIFPSRRSYRYMECSGTLCSEAISVKTNCKTARRDNPLRYLKARK